MRYSFTGIPKFIGLILTASAVTAAHAAEPYIDDDVVNMNVAQELKATPGAISDMISGRSLFINADKVGGFYLYFSTSGDLAMASYKNRPMVGQLLRKVAIGRWTARPQKICFDISSKEAAKMGGGKAIKQCFKTQIKAYPRFDPKAARWRLDDRLLYITGNYINQIYKGDKFGIGKALRGGQSMKHLMPRVLFSPVNCWLCISVPMEK